MRPPYLLTGTPRPQVDLEETTRLGYESTLEIPITNGVNVISANLIRLGSTTHQNDMDQRFIPLSDDGGVHRVVITLGR